MSEARRWGEPEKRERILEQLREEMTASGLLRCKAKRIAQNTKLDTGTVGKYLSQFATEDATDGVDVSVFHSGGRATVYEIATVDDRGQLVTDGGEDAASPILVQEQNTREFGLFYPDDGVIETYDGNDQEELDVGALVGENWQEADEEDLRSSIEEDIEDIREDIGELRHRPEELTDEQARELDRLESRLESQENILALAEEVSENHSPPESINQFVTAGAHGFAAVDGPFMVEKEGTKWTVTVPLDDDDALAPGRAELSTLKSMQAGEPAVLIADGEAVGGGVIETVYDPEGEKERHIIVDQYAAGDL